MTIEDPIEFLHAHKRCLVNQRELGSDAQSFADALKAALRQDPDVILVGEMRDLETISTALTAAETGHLVFATLHTQDAAQTIDRIIDVFPPHQQGQVRVQLSVALQGIVTQQLLPTADGSGRVVACEVLVPTPARAQPDPRGQDPPDLLGAADRHRARDADDGRLAGDARPRQDKISQKTAESRSSTPEELRRLLGAGRGAGADDEHLRLQGDGPRRRARRGRGRRRLQAGGLRPAEGARADRPGHRRQARLARDQHRRFFERVNASDLAVFSRQLSTMISSGMSILRALYVLEEQTENKLLKETIVAVRKDVEAGLPLSDAMERHPKVFNPLFVAMTRAGETGGVLEGSLLRVADQLEKDASLRRQIKLGDGLPDAGDRLRDRRDDRAGRLPRAGVRERLQGIRRRTAGDHQDLGRALARRHQLLVPAVIGGTVAVIVAFLKWKRAPWGRPQWDRFRLRIPMKIGDDRAEGRDRALVAHALGADRRRRAAAAGARDHRQDRRQRGRRGGDGRA